MTTNRRSTHGKPAVATDHRDDPELQMFQRQVRRFAGEGDCAYERALGTLYQKLFEERLLELTALRNSGL